MLYAAIFMSCMKGSAVPTGWPGCPPAPLNIFAFRPPAGFIFARLLMPAIFDAVHGFEPCAHTSVVSLQETRTALMLRIRTRPIHRQRRLTSPSVYAQSERRMLRSAHAAQQASVKVRWHSARGKNRQMCVVRRECAKRENEWRKSAERAAPAAVRDGGARWRGSAARHARGSSNKQPVYHPRAVKGCRARFCTRVKEWQNASAVRRAPAQAGR